MEEEIKEVSLRHSPRLTSLPYWRCHPGIVSIGNLAHPQLLRHSPAPDSQTAQQLSATMSTLPTEEGGAFKAQMRNCGWNQNEAGPVARSQAVCLLKSP